MSPRSIRSRTAGANKAILAFFLALVALLSTACGQGNLPQNALDPEGREARTVDRLWDLVLPIAGVIFVLVMALVVYVVLRFRARSDEDAPVQVHGNPKAELAWTIAPAAILAVVGFFTLVTLFDINERAEGSDVLQVKVIGHQWWWEYEYPDQNIVTANELHIPAGQTVQLQLTSADVIHNFWPPKLAGKVYAIPGRTNYMKLHADEPGDYSGQCAEYCGLSHANMRLKVIAHSPADFEQWVRNQQRPAPAPPTTTTLPTTSTTVTAGTGEGTTVTGADAGTSLDDADRPEVGTDPMADRAAGAELFISKGCSGCHTINGLQGANGRKGPDLTHLFSRSTFAGSIFELDEKNLRKWLRDPPGMKPMIPENNQGMPNLGLSEDEITQLIAYLETLT